MSDALDVTGGGDAAQAASQARDMGCHSGTAYHRVVSHRRPSPQDVEGLLIEAAQGQRVPTAAKDAAGRLLTRMTVAPWSIGAIVPEAGSGGDYRVTLNLGARQVGVLIRCQPHPHVVRVG